MKVNLPFHGAKVTFTIGGTTTAQYLNGDEIIAIPNDTTIKSQLLGIDKNVSINSENNKVVLNLRNRTTPENCIAGVFSVSGDKQIFFSKGNLQATTTDNGYNWTFGFAKNQYDYIGNNAVNTKIDGDGTVSEKGTVDLFGWVGASSTWTGAAQYGISNSTMYNSTDTYGNVSGEALKSDWGSLMGDGSTWQTLSTGEWAYLLGTSKERTEKNGLGTISVEKNTYFGLIILPDGYKKPDGVSNDFVPGETNTEYSEGDWNAMESAGAVFLPAAGFRLGSSVSNAGSLSVLFGSCRNNRILS